MYFNRENRVILLLLLLLLSFASAEESHCQPNEFEFLTTFHPHLDAFWLNNDEQLTNINFVPAPFLYAMNQRNSKTILNSMLTALSEKSERKYFITEVFFFKDWYDDLDQERKGKVQDLLKRGQFQVVNGGWVENDEAVCYYDDVLDQYSIGLHFMSKFGVDVKIGWATDSFGHSHSQVALQHLLGFQFQGIERVDDRYIYQRNGGNLLEFYWTPRSDSNNLTYGGLVTHVRHFLHEVNDMRNTYPETVAGDYKKLEKMMKKMYGKNKLFRFLGNDFEEFVSQQFKTLEDAMTILRSTIKNTNCTPYRYGNPSDYLEIIKQYYSNNTNLKVREEDLMPNWDQDHYWTGYYTTNPKLKKVVKDYSRLVNLFRKVYLKYKIQGNKVTAQYKQILKKADELLALIQHHDGITGTAKYNIQEKYIKQMQELSVTIGETISMMNQLNGKQICSLLQNGNTCELMSDQEKVYFTILHEGAPKKERIELSLKDGIYYDIQDEENDEIFCNEKTQRCMLVFQAALYAGENNFVLVKSLEKEVINIKNIPSLSYEDNLIKLSLIGQRIDYTFNEGKDFFNFSLVQSPSRTSQTQTVYWNKYGQKNTKTESKIAGLYIMANTGTITGINLAEYNSLAVGIGKKYTKIYVSSLVNTLIMTIDNSNTHIVDLDSEFQPPSRQYVDYFIRIESKVLPSSNYYYHDSNGYLVKRRQINFRPDYSWVVKPEDKISANTYPACSFAYVTDEQKKVYQDSIQLVIFLDRAEGVALFDRFLMVNIDRLAGDDYKGAGEGYSFQIKNRFRHRVGLFGKDEVIERVWQRQFDEGLLGFYSQKERKDLSEKVEKDKVDSKYAKYTVFFLNQKEVVLRIINLNDKNSLKLSKYSKESWNLPLFGLSLNFQNIEETFAHGNSIIKRHKWINKIDSISIENSASKDRQSELTFSQLQIRSFKLTISPKQSPIIPHFAQKIKMHHHLNRCF